MFPLRRLALRALPFPSTPIAARSRPITSFALSIPRPSNSCAASVKLQKRFASEEATQAEPEADGAKEVQHGESQETSQSTDTEQYSQYSPPTSAYESIVDEVSDKTSRVAQSISDSTQSARESVSQAFGSATSGLNLRPEIPPGPSIFVGNIFFETEADDLKREFENAGPIERVRIIKDVRGLSKGFGYIDYKDTESASRAVEMFNERNFEGRRLSVQFSDRNELNRERNNVTRKAIQNPPSKTLFIGNLAFDMTDRDLNNLFSNIKDVFDVRVAIDRRTGQPRGFAHADFTSVKSAEAALSSLEGKEVCGRTLRLDFSAPSVGKNPRQD